jgi:tight adherence protein B
MSALPWSAVLFATASAAAVAHPAPGRLVRRRLGVCQSLSRRPRRALVRRASLTVGVAFAAALSTRHSLGAALVAVAAVAGLAGGALARKTRLRQRATQRRGAVLEICDQLAAELRAGQPPARALAHAAELWPDLQPAAAAASLGGDVPDALRSLSTERGTEALAAVAAAWQVAMRSGAGLAGVLDRMAEALRAEDATRREVAAALGPPRATARLLAALPVFGLLLGTGVGADPWSFLFRTPLGVGCLALGTCLALAGLAWVERLADSAEE